MKNEECRMKNVFYTAHGMCNFHSSFYILHLNFSFFIFSFFILHLNKNPSSHPHFGYSQLMVVQNAPCVVHSKKMCWTMRHKRKMLLSRHS